MKTVAKTIFLLMITTFNLFSQELKKDNRYRIQQEDPYTPLA